ncbi:LmeA family phospholipid-binding protein [Hoyosella sp. YIM 151337]|uniref:LmeA family phospholipid-binding protein n=1 Tax=Hoyosella sp. YIM 151337 TaxID=2992742 RepID=UPI002236BA27|nr:DUF2993 domain-containing protein [Hoyosella sp. YIM 151337]MCW4356078.1 LmeA family phospholipid-binding protein [Hoyosella sp. YIM 151337]
MRKLIVGALGLVVVLVLAELGTAAYTEHRISRALRASADLNADPDVVVRGFPFLVQAARGEFVGVDIRADRVDTDIAGRVTIEAGLDDVTLEPAAWYKRRTDAMHARILEGRIVMHQTELGEFYDIPDLRITPLPTGIIDAFGTATPVTIARFRPVLLTATFPQHGITEEVNVEARLRLSGRQLNVEPMRYYPGRDGSWKNPVPEELRDEILRSFSITIDVQEVPFGLPPAVAYAQGGRLVVEGEGRNVSLELLRRNAIGGGLGQ